MARDFGLLVLRLGIGVTFIMHGYPKLFPSGVGGFAGFLHNLGFPVPGFLAWVVALVEFVGGIAMLAGLFVRAVGVLMAIEMIVTTVRVKMARGVGFIAPQGTGWEVDFLLLCVAGSLALIGAGGLALDALRRPGRRDAAL